MLLDFQETYQNLLNYYQWNFHSYKSINYMLNLILNYWENNEIEFNFEQFSRDYPKFVKPLSVKFPLLKIKYNFKILFTL